MDLKEIKGKGVGSINLDQEKENWWALVNTGMNHWVP